MSKNLTVCVLLYGDYLELAKRCLTSVVKAFGDNSQIRVGANEISSATRDWAFNYLQDSVADYLIFDSPTNIHKYPLMRTMVHGDHKIDTDFMMWFDDDSYVDFDKMRNPQIPLHQQITAAMQGVDMIGSPYQIGWRRDQREFVKAQPWYNGRDPYARGAISFMTGGWWVIRTELLYEFDYPWPVLDHCGGDTMLGEMMYQQERKLRKFTNGIRINADADGNESRAERRGFSQLPVGTEWKT